MLVRGLCSARVFPAVLKLNAGDVETSKGLWDTLSNESPKLYNSPLTLVNFKNYDVARGNRDNDDFVLRGHNGDVTIAWDIDSNSRELCANGIADFRVTDFDTQIPLQTINW